MTSRVKYDTHTHAIEIHDGNSDSRTTEPQPTHRAARLPRRTVEYELMSPVFAIFRRDVSAEKSSIINSVFQNATQNIVGRCRSCAAHICLVKSIEQGLLKDEQGDSTS